MKTKCHLGLSELEWNLEMHNCKYIPIWKKYLLQKFLEGNVVYLFFFYPWIKVGQLTAVYWGHWSPPPPCFRCDEVSCSCFVEGHCLK